MKEFEEKFPLCKTNNKELYDSVLHHYLVMKSVSRRIKVPLEELMDFFYRGKLQLEVIKEQEEVLKDICQQKE